MPELPEIETIKLGLQKEVIGKTVESITKLNENSFKVSEKDISDKILDYKMISVKRVGKVLMLELSSGYTMAFHLKMTGQVVYRSKNYNFGGGHPTGSLINKLPDKSTRVIIELNSGGELFFNDQRKFGWIKLIKTGQHQDLVKNMGPDMYNDVDITTFIDRVKSKKNSRIKQVLLDQSVVAGIGNIYADESLFIAGIHPDSKISAIPEAKLNLLFGAIKDVFTRSIDMGGSSSRNYVNSSGGRGNYLDEAKAYGRDGQECEKCKQNMIKIRSAGRGTHICADCQRLYQ